MARRKKDKKLRGGIGPPLLFIGILVLASYILGTTLTNRSVSDTTQSYTIDKSASYTQQQKGSVQMEDVKFVKDTPTSAPTHAPVPAGCSADSGQTVPPDCVCPDVHITCQGGKCVKIDYEKSGTGLQFYTCELVDQYELCKTVATQGDGDYCIGKPVIYLYPEKPTTVNVNVETAGNVFTSDPQIESKNTWTNVLAHPDGTLIYRNKTYNELFYESTTKVLRRPEKGIVMTKQNLEPQLRTFINRLGLTKPSEQQEFLDWWIPRLEKISTGKIFVSILTKDEKDRVDHVSISPRPDTFIEFIAYFAPLAEGETVQPLALPPTPIRKGFTAVEWGGVIGE